MKFDQLHRRDFITLLGGSAARALAPDVILATGSSALGPLLQTTRAVPIVFVIVPDPVGSGFVDSLARPGGNATGFLSFEFGISGKWLELLKEIAPRVTRAAVIRDSAITAGIGQWGAIQTAAPSLSVEVSPVNVGDASEIERVLAAFARSANGGLIALEDAIDVSRSAPVLVDKIGPIGDQAATGDEVAFVVDCWQFVLR